MRLIQSYGPWRWDQTVHEDETRLSLPYLQCYRVTHAGYLDFCHGIMKVNKGWPRKGKGRWHHSAYPLTWNQRITATKHFELSDKNAGEMLSSTSPFHCRVVLGRQCKRTEINQGQRKLYYIQRGYFPFVLKLKSHASSRKRRHRFFSLIASTFKSKVNMCLQLSAEDCSVIARLFYVCEATKTI